MFPFKPAKANAEDQSSVAQMIDCRRHFGQYGRMPEGIARDHGSNLDLGGLRCHRGKQRPGFEVDLVRWANTRQQVVVRPQRIKTQGFGFLPDFFEFFDCGLLLGNLQAKFNRFFCIFCVLGG